MLGIVDDNPGEFMHHVNDDYPDAPLVVDGAAKRPCSTAGIA